MLMAVRNLTKGLQLWARLSTLQTRPAVRPPARLPHLFTAVCLRDLHTCTAERQVKGGFQYAAASPTPRIAGTTLDHNTTMLKISWEGGGEDEYPYLWMRDNCQCAQCYHPTAKNRSLLMTQLRADDQPQAIQVSAAGDEIQVQWTDGHISWFSSQWLQDRAFNPHHQQKQLNTHDLEKVFWGSEKKGHLHHFNFDSLMGDDKDLLAFLEVLEIDGVAVVTDMPCELGQINKLTKKRIGYLKNTHYGETFNVKSKTNASNVAYTPGPLDLHSDMVYIKEKPGIQMFHCLAQAQGSGGDNLLVDSFHVGSEMRRHRPDMFRLLTDTIITYTDFGYDSIGQFHTITRLPTIQCDDKGNITNINVSNHSRDSYFPVTAEGVIEWYKAYLAFRDMLNDPKYCITKKLEKGEMLVTDNYRVLHGRLAFTSCVGERHLESGYWDWDEVKSRRRVLRAQFDES